MSPASHWPLLPPLRGAGEPVPRDEPLRAAFDALAAVALLLLALRLGAGDTAAPGRIATAIALHGGRVGHELTQILLPLTGLVPCILWIAPGRPSPPDALVQVYDAALHLGLVLTACAALASLALRGAPDLPFQWFAAEAALLWACHRARLAVLDETPVGRSPRRHGGKWK